MRKRKEYADYEWFDSDNNKRCISSSDAMKDIYHVVNQCYEAKGQGKNGWIKNSNGILLTDNQDDVFKERFH